MSLSRTILLVAPAFLAATSTSFAAEANRTSWVLDGYYEAEILSSNIEESPNAPFEGLVVQCSSSTGRARIRVQDLTAPKGAEVKYYTDKTKGTFITGYPYLVALSADYAKKNSEIIAAIINGNTITFEVDEQKATYSLKGSGKAIRSMKVCGKNY